MKESIISGIQGALIGTASAVVVLTGMEFFFPTPDTFTTDLNKRETTTLSTIRTVGLVEFSPGICRYEYLNSQGPTLIVSEEACPVYTTMEFDTHNPNPKPGFLRPVESTDY